MRLVPLVLLSLALIAGCQATAPTAPIAVPTTEPLTTTTASSTPSATPSPTAAPTVESLVVVPRRGTVRQPVVEPVPRAAPRTTVAPRPTSAPPRRDVVAPTSKPTTAGAYYANCTAAKAAGVAPLYRGQPGYRAALDRDNDGVACET